MRPRPKSSSPWPRSKRLRQTEEARLLGLELDSDTDPEGVVGKLLATPAGCTLLLTEFSNFSIRVNDYNVLIWSSRERLFHCLGKRLEDLFNGDPVIHDWLVAMLGTVFGDRGEGKALAIAEVLHGLRPDWMDHGEFDARMDALAAQLPDRATSAALVRTYLDEVIADLNERLELARVEHRVPARAQPQGCVGRRFARWGATVELQARARAVVRRRLPPVRGAQERGRVERRPLRRRSERRPGPPPMR